MRSERGRATGSGPACASPVVAYAMLAAATQLLWLTFAPLTTASAHHYHVSETAIGWLAEIFPLLYVVLALPAGRLLDRSLHRWLAFGAVLTALGGVVRLLGLRLSAGRCSGRCWSRSGSRSCSTPSRRSPPSTCRRERRPHGIAIGSAGIFAGMLLALVLGTVFGGAASRGAARRCRRRSRCSRRLATIATLRRTARAPAPTSPRSRSTRSRCARSGRTAACACSRACCSSASAPSSRCATWLQALLHNYRVSVDDGRHAARRDGARRRRRRRRAAADRRQPPGRAAHRRRLGRGRRSSGGLLLAFEHAVAVDAIALVPIGLLLLDRPAGDPRAQRAARRRSRRDGDGAAVARGQRRRARSSRCSCSCSCTTRRRRSCCSRCSACCAAPLVVRARAAGSRARSDELLRQGHARPRRRDWIPADGAQGRQPTRSRSRRPDRPPTRRLASARPCAGACASRCCAVPTRTLSRPAVARRERGPSAPPRIAACLRGGGEPAPPSLYNSAYTPRPPMSNPPINDQQALGSRTEVLRASPPMFRWPWLDRLSRVHPVVPPLIFLPAIVVLAGDRARRRGRRRRRCSGILGGYLLWTLSEYWIHRVIFHFEPEDGIGARAALDGPRRPPRPPERPAAAASCRPPSRCRSAALFVVAFVAIFGTPLAWAVSRRLPRRLPRLRHAALRAAPPPPAAHGARASPARAAHAPPLRGRHARLRDQRAVVGHRLRHLPAPVLIGVAPAAAPRRRRGGAAGPERAACSAGVLRVGGVGCRPSGRRAPSPRVGRRRRRRLAGRGRGAPSAAAATRRRGRSGVAIARRRPELIECLPASKC